MPIVEVELMRREVEAHRERFDRRSDRSGDERRDDRERHRRRRLGRAAAPPREEDAPGATSEVAWSCTTIRSGVTMSIVNKRPAMQVVES